MGDARRRDFKDRERGPVVIRSGAMAKALREQVGIAGRLAWASAVVIGVGMTASCSMLLDVDSLQKGTGAGGAGVDGGEDASAGSGGTAGQDGGGGAGGAAGESGTGGAGGADAGPAEVPLSELGDALAQAACANLRACAGPLAELWYHEDSCEAFLGATLQDTFVAAIARSVEQGPFTYDAAKGAECVKNLLEGAALEPPQCADLQKGLDDCRAAVGNLAAAGGGCTHYYECQAGNYCDTTTTCPGTCKPVVQADGVCSKSEQCALGLTCMKPVAGDGTCQPYTPTDGDCGQGKPDCELGDYCVSNKCLPVADAFVMKAGYECYSNGLFCETPLSCGFNGIPLLSKGTCAEPIGAAQPCVVGIPEACDTGLYCTYGQAVEPQCAALPGLNQACAKATVQTLGISPPCVAGLACVNDICLPRKRLGEECAGDTQCYSGRCTGADAGTGECELPPCL